MHRLWGGGGWEGGLLETEKVLEKWNFDLRLTFVSTFLKVFAFLVKSCVQRGGNGSQVPLLCFGAGMEGSK